jgi:hypothetical protein
MTTNANLPRLEFPTTPALTAAEISRCRRGTPQPWRAEPSHRARRSGDLEGLIFSLLPTAQAELLEESGCGLAHLRRCRSRDHLFASPACGFEGEA